METFNPFSLKKKSILVTGASSGIGKEIAVACSKMGANVFITEQKNMFPVDLTSEEEIFQLSTLLPKLDGVVHCAGIGYSKLCRQVQSLDIEKVFSVNFNAPVLLQAQLLKQKKMNKSSSIVFIVSNATSTANIGNSIYCASKGALLAYANCLKLEVAPRLIRVNCISPGMVRGIG